jgi:indole-3-glycerol phosphate synthase
MRTGAPASLAKESRWADSRIIVESAMAASLEQIIAATRRRVAEARRNANSRELERLAQEHSPRGFRRALKAVSQTRPAIIAELKKASPSRGLIRENFDPAVLASEFESAGATALSVLTDEEFFQGSLQNLRIASEATRLPCLRKDFIVDESQLLEARAHRADAVLLIVAALSQQELSALFQQANQIDLDVLCEVHEEEELKRALDAGCDIIGVNSRDLRTFQVDLNTALRLGEKIPRNTIRVAESGIHSGADVAKLRAVGYDAFLIGESLMKAASPGQALRTLMKDAVAEKASAN